MSESWQKLRRKNCRRIQDHLYAAAEALEIAEPYLSDCATYKTTKDMIAGAWNLVDLMIPEFPGEAGDDVEEF